MSERIAFLQHSPSDVPGLLGEFAVDLGLEVSASTVRTSGSTTCLPIGSFNLLAVMGSIEST